MAITVECAGHSAMARMVTATSTSVRVRQITIADVGALADLLAKGFPERSRQFWVNVFQRMSKLPTPDGFPKFGYLLDGGDQPVGVVLVLSARLPGSAEHIRCNVSSWYVEPGYRSLASVLVAHAMRRHPSQYLNVTSDPQTWPTIEAQGFRRYVDGVFLCVPALSWRGRGLRLHVVGSHRNFDERLSKSEQSLLADHVRFGCLAYWCEDGEEAFPFIFVRRLLWRRNVPYAQLAYCRQIEDVVRFAGPIGRALASQGLPLVLMDSNGPVEGLWGFYIPNKMPKYFCGGVPPPLGDLSYTEVALFGV
jgi:hypothetical protein